MAFLEDERRRDAASRPDPEQAVIRADYFLEDLIKVDKQGGLPRHRVQEILNKYIAASTDHLETARAFQKELATSA